MQIGKASILFICFINLSYFLIHSAKYMRKIVRKRQSIGIAASAAIES
jgi:hypothetical protein